MYAPSGCRGCVAQRRNRRRKTKSSPSSRRGCDVGPGGERDRAVVGDVLGEALVDRVAQVVALRGRELRDPLAQAGRELELRVPPVVEARVAEGEADLVDLREHEARLLQR